MGTMTEEQAARVAQISRAPIALTEVSSSQIAAIGHDPETSTLAVRFRAKAGYAVGPLYHYGNVDAVLYEAFRTADSIGSFFYANIKPNADEFPYAKVESDMPLEAGGGGQ